MKSKKIILLIKWLVILVFFQSCEIEKEGENETKISENGGSSSHKMGQNCMTCHKSGGSGEGWFSIAGTVYDSSMTDTYANMAVSFSTSPNGTGELKYIIAGDALGNFYTTQTIDFGTGLYTSVRGEKIDQYMITPVTSGQCNSCHGTATDKIWTK
jgi:hypothetical protein